jgi:hypothetical protein
MALLRHAEGHRECLFFGVDRKSSAHAQNGAFEPIATERHSSSKDEDDDGLTDTIRGRRAKQKRSGSDRRAFRPSLGVGSQPTY